MNGSLSSPVAGWKWSRQTHSTTMRRHSPVKEAGIGEGPRRGCPRSTVGRHPGRCYSTLLDTGSPPVPGDANRQSDVYKWCMARTRTNIEIDDRWIQAIQQRFGVTTKTEAVDLALRHLAGQPMTRDEALAMGGTESMAEVPGDVGPEPA